MIRCLLFGHKPHPVFEYHRVGSRSVTYCERCGVGVTQLVSVGRPLPDSLRPREEAEDEIAERIAEKIRGRIVSETDQFTDEIDIVIREALEEHGFPKKRGAKAIPVSKRPKRSMRVKSQRRSEGAEHG